MFIHQRFSSSNSWNEWNGHENWTKKFLNIHVVAMFAEPINPPPPATPPLPTATHNYPLFCLHLIWSRNYNVILIHKKSLTISSQQFVRSPCCCHLLQLLYICCCSTLAGFHIPNCIICRKQNCPSFSVPRIPGACALKLDNFKQIIVFKWNFIYIYILEWPLLIFSTLNPKTIKP
jgi:hypothetical protein